MKSVLIVGMGTLGRHLAMKMKELGNEVLIIDKNEEIIQELSEEFENALVGDCTNEAVLRSVGVNNFDLCFVAIGEDFYSSIEITSILKELGASFVISKAKLKRHEQFLKKIGADEVFFPEREIAEKLAIRFNADNIFDCIELTSEYSIFEIPTPQSWIGKAIKDVNPRNRHNINIIAIKNGTSMSPVPGGEYIFRENDHIVLIGRSTDVFTMTSDDR